MSDSYGDLVSDALRAEAEEARARLRAAGITCPSCGTNAADLGPGHELKFSDSPAAEGSVAQCATGMPVDLADADFGILQGLAGVRLLDDFGRRMGEAVAEQIAGPPRTEPCEGFLAVLQGSAGPSPDAA